MEPTMIIQIWHVVRFSGLCLLGLIVIIGLIRVLAAIDRDMHNAGE